MTGKSAYENELSPNVAVEGLRTAVMLLETELSVLENRRSDLYKRLNSFRVRYNATLGMLLGDILRLRLEEFRMLQDSNPDILEQLHEAESDYQKHQRSYQESREEVIPQISKVRDKELQQKFHRASKLCHPDLVDESHRDRATEIFMDLNNAYYHNNIDRVSAILEMLIENQYGLASRSAALTGRAMLEMYESRLKTDIAGLKAEIQQIRESKPFLHLMDIEDMDRYFEEMKGKLTLERDRMIAHLDKKRRGYEGE